LVFEAAGVADELLMQRVLSRNDRLANFDLFDIPSVNVGDRIKIDAYPQQERVRTDRD
jgi:hypothetical protein